ncbi:metal-dependent hydrolase [Paenibacillus sp. NEAU-GSW1]|uniref:metal-dependent hydrolase n=1 Tax=Paenibacillus sp. NEAU-GSW1 TaxID=2682486 RepID=UPI0012E2E4E8|nr:metal-dependent hydrolase [Paenibacillus sp. NEAU-GSW1]MUT66912.1 metal-dependent hydrolase [Paenibacillus sp. NEAU-GSW1]
MKITFHGHSCIQLTDGGNSLVVDPFLRGNPLAVSKPEDIKVSHILLTHAHTDHILDAEPIARANNASVIANVELASYMSWKGLETVGMNIGGTLDLGFAKVKMIQAFHSSGITIAEEQRIIYGGMPAGYIVFSEGKTILHAGDTALFSDMKMIGERHPIDVAFIPIGDHFTMGPGDALQAAEWFGAKLTIPMHYNSFPIIRQDAELFVQQLKSNGLKGQVLEPGESITI